MESESNIEFFIIVAFFVIVILGIIGSQTGNGVTHGL